MSKLNELYRQKGEALTNIEIWQGKLRAINNDISAELGKPGTIKEAQEELKAALKDGSGS